MHSVRILLSAVACTTLLLAAAPGTAEETATSANDTASPANDANPGNSGKADPEPHPDASGRETLCLIMESAARSNGLPLEFFARVIWQESRFKPDAVGPVTRNGQRAQGIAQFMPGTASERQLLDPFDPVQALPKSAEFLSELRHQFGNLGLAAAAYNAGPRRVQDWLSGSGAMPQETRNYVLAITGIGIEDWADANKTGGAPNRFQNGDCHGLLASLQTAPNSFASALQRRVTRAASRPWGVQIAAGFNRDDALAMYARAMKSLSATIGEGREPLLVRSPGTSTFYHVQIGADTRRQADDLCARLRRAGGACLVKQNQRGVATAARGHRASRVHLARHAVPIAARAGGNAASRLGPTHPD